jgi:Rrf2 family protein
MPSFHKHFFTAFGTLPPLEIIDIPWYCWNIGNGGDAMKISTKGRYALRVMIDLAQNHTGEFIPLRDVAGRQGITIKYLEQIIGSLNKSRFLKSSRGSGGGYKLMHEPREYRVGDILRSVEGNLAVVACLEDSPNDCPRSGECITLPFWQGLNHAVEKYVDGVTLADIMSGTAGRKRKDGKRH